MDSGLSFEFRGEKIPVTHASSIPKEHAEKALVCGPFQTWVERCERDVLLDQSGSITTYQRLNLHGVEYQSIDMFGARGVGFIKLKSNTTLSTIEKNADGKIIKEEKHDKPLPGICFLRGSAVSILVALFCGDKVYSLLVDQPRVPIGQASCLEIPAGMVDDETQSVAGIAVQEMREECSIHIKSASELVDLTELALSGHVDKLPCIAIPPSPGGCDEFLRCFYLEKKVTESELNFMKDRLQGLRDHGEYITLRVVPFEDVWKVSGDAKAMVSLFLLDQLRKEGKVPAAGSLATPLSEKK